ncbi:MAG: pyruvate synthase subunit PorB [Candidatus Thermoplasmatota archaeon]|nr:pyruvate synthase subunit PorB [Candidatus Thermoplasmatota archaeon]
MNEELFLPGHRGCAGCGETIAVRQILSVAGENTIAVVPTGCLEVVSTSYPETAWKIPLIHVAFENAAAVASGIDCALKASGKRKGINVLAFAGDGGTFDIGLQALSGMLERGHNVKYICLDNEAYMNTGIQRSSATPYAASTTTSPLGKYSIGESRKKKPIGAICIAHDIPYVATATIAYHLDLKKKIKKALEIDGPCFMHILVPCPTGWRFPSELTIELSRLAVETGVFPLWECEGSDMSNLKITKKAAHRKPVKEYLQLQGRFAHVMRNEKLLAEIQKEVDEKCAKYGL